MVNMKLAIATIFCFCKILASRYSSLTVPLLRISSKCRHYSPKLGQTPKLHYIDNRIMRPSGVSEKTDRSHDVVIDCQPFGLILWTNIETTLYTCHYRCSFLFTFLRTPVKVRLTHKKLGNLTYSADWPSMFFAVLKTFELSTAISGNHFWRFYRYWVKCTQALSI